MSFDIHNALDAVKLYGQLTIIVLVVVVLQPQKLIGVFAAGGAWGDWTAHIGGDFGWNLLAVILAVAVAWFIDLFGLRRQTGAGSRNLSGRR